MLTFDPFTPEHNGYYSCQADIGIQFDETEEVLVQGKNRTTDQGKVHIVFYVADFTSSILDWIYINTHYIDIIPCLTLAQ